MMNPTPTTCIAGSAGIPNSEHAIGISRSDPPATPEVPQAARVLSTESRTAEAMSTGIPSVRTVASVMMVMTTAAPSMLIVAPNGIETEYTSLSRPSRSHSRMFTGMFAAEERVKNAVIPLSLMQRKISGYGFRLRMANTISGLTISATVSIDPTSSRISMP